MKEQRAKSNYIKNIRVIAHALLMIILFLSCTSFRADRRWESEKKLNWGKIVLDLMIPEFTPREKNERESNNAQFQLTGILPEQAVLHGSVIGNEGNNMILKIESLDWFGNWTNGWTEATFILSGELALERISNEEPYHYKIQVRQMPHIEYVESAKMRYRDTILSDETARNQFKNRMDRITATCELEGMMAATLIAEQSDSQKAQKEFINSAGKYLFPERYGYPSEFAYTKGGPWSYGEDIRWNTAYTTAVFPEEFHEIRNTGTLFRDWEETKPLFYLICRWDDFFTNMTGDIPLVERK